MSDEKPASQPLTQQAFTARPISDEDKYFAAREQEIIEDLRDSRTARAAAERRCPNISCQNIVLDKVMENNVEIERCPQCHGIWLDAGELELLMQRAKGSPNGLARFFRNLSGDYSV